MLVASPVHEELPAAGHGRRGPATVPLPAAVPPPVLAGTARHLVQRPLNREQFVLGGGTGDDFGFVLFDELPAATPSAPGEADRAAALRFVTEAMDEVARFTARRARLSPDRRTPRITRASVEITDVEPWRLAGRRGQAVVDLRVRVITAGGGARELVCVAGVHVDGVPCATARARLAFSGTPVSVPAGTETARLIEASRRAATLAAGEVRGLSPEHCVLTRWSARLRAEPDGRAPLRCRARAGGLTRDAKDRAVVPVRVDLLQDERHVGVVTASVLQDC